jgi:hypothetical protein
MMIIASYHLTTYIGIDDVKDNEIREIAKSFGGKFVGSGSGYFHRDLEFKFDDYVNSENFMSECRILGLEVTIID